MDINEIDLWEHLPEERMKEIEYTKETFHGSNLEALWKAMLIGMEKTIQDETNKLMKEHSLSYGEARNIAFKRTMNSTRLMMKGE